MAYTTTSVYPMGGYDGIASYIPYPSSFTPPTTSSKPKPPCPDIHKIISKPEESMVIIVWADKTRTIAKAEEDDVFDEDYGIMMAVMKKIFGSYSKYEKLIEGKLNEK